MWDATCPDTSATAVIQSALDPGSAARGAEERKRARYASLCERCIFAPFAVGTAGVVGPAAAELVKELGRRLTARTGDRRETAWLYQRVSVAVVRGNAASVLATAKSAVNGPLPPPPVRAPLPTPPPRSLGTVETAPSSQPATPPDATSMPDKAASHQTTLQPDPATPADPAQPLMSPLEAVAPPPSVDDRPQTRRMKRRQSASSLCCPGACACPTFGR